jgi:diadenosine tetraphosphate (Ap4A) HIT family hydrolase
MSASEWPDNWEERKAGVDCPLCAELGRDTDDDHAVFITALNSSEVRLERRSRLPGYCIVVWRHSHVTEPTELAFEAASEYWSDVLAVSRAVEVEFHPVKMNLLTLGNWVPHLHTHVLPRYPDDPAPGGPITWADVFNPDPTPPDVLYRQAAMLRKQLNPPT